MSNELEVIPAAVATQLEALKQNILIFDKSLGDALDAAETYAYLCGRELARAKETIPHGNKGNGNGFMRWVEANFPRLSYKTAVRRIEFAETLQPKLDSVSNFKELPALLDDGQPNPESVKAIREAVYEAMDGKSMTAFLRDENRLRAPKSPNDGDKNAPKELSPEEELAAWKDRDNAALQSIVDSMRTYMPQEDDDQDRPRYHTPELAKEARRIGVEFTKFLKRSLGKPKKAKAAKVSAVTRAKIAAAMHKKGKA